MPWKEYVSNEESLMTIGRKNLLFYGCECLSVSLLMKWKLEQTWICEQRSFCKIGTNNRLFFEFRKTSWNFWKTLWGKKIWGNWHSQDKLTGKMAEESMSNILNERQWIAEYEERWIVKDQMLLRTKRDGNLRSALKRRGIWKNKKLEHVCIYLNSFESDMYP